MGIMKAVATKLTHRGAHLQDPASIINANTDALTANTQIEWSVKSPTVVRRPLLGTTKQADQAEQAAAAYKVAADNGRRILQAETQRQRANARLTVAHREYMAETASAHLQAATANARLGTHLQGVRVATAELGMGLERTIQRGDQAVAQIAHKYGAIG
jgi:hypothetical protein